MSLYDSMLALDVVAPTGDGLFALVSAGPDTGTLDIAGLVPDCDGLIFALAATESGGGGETQVLQRVHPALVRVFPGLARVYPR